MATSYHGDPRVRVPAALAAAGIQAALAYVLVSGLALHVATRIGERLQVIALPVTPSPSPTPSPEPEPERARAAAPAEQAGAAGRRARATQVVAPKPRIVLPVPPPIVVATVAGSGNEATSGSAVAGEGPGGGGGGLGPGGGGGGGGRGAQRIGGALRDSDYPAAAARVRAAGTVVIRFRVGLDGHVHDCRVTVSSGSEVLDSTTCRLVEKRLRYRPALDAAGRPVESSETTDFTWGPRDF